MSRAAAHMRTNAAGLRSRANRWRDTSVAVASIVAGAAALLARPFLVGRGTVSLLVMYVALLGVAVAAPIPAPALRPAGAAPVRAGTVGLVGLAALTAVHFVVGPAVPAPAASLLATLGLSALAAVAEEALFRRLLYGWLTPYGPFAAVVLSAAAFAAIHVPAYGAAAVWVDFGAGLLFAWQRWTSGGWGAPAATHVAANVLAALR
jgi:membrane protease YdiL (CAAX protease family)